MIKGILNNATITIKETMKGMLNSAAIMIGTNFQKTLNALGKDGNELSLERIVVDYDSSIVKFFFNHSELTAKESDVITNYYNYIFDSKLVTVNASPTSTIFNMDVSNIATA